MTRNAYAIFADIDGFDPQKFVANLAEDVIFRFGNADAVVGRDAVAEAVTGFFSSIAGLTHHIQNMWEVGPDATVAFIEVEYRRLDGETVYIPNVDILTWTGDLVSDWKIIIDVSAIYTPIDQVSTAARAPLPALAGADN